MQVKPCAFAIALVAGLGLAPAARGAALQGFDQATLNSMMRYFTDSDHIVVRSLTNDYAWPLRENVALSLHWNNERVTIPAIQAPI